MNEKNAKSTTKELNDDKKTKEESINNKITKSEKKIINKKSILISIISIFTILLIIGTILFCIKRIPSKYYGTYVRYFYYNGIESKITYKISPLSIKSIFESTDNGKKKIEKENYKYYKKENDLIIKQKKLDSYVIIDDDRLYVESSKDISSSKKYGLFYWNEKSDKADLYEIKNKSEGFEDILETSVNLWARKVIYDAFDVEMEDTNFYILDSDGKSDETDLNTYEIKLKASGGELSLYYDRKNQKLKQIYFSGSVLTTTFSGTESDSMAVNDLYDCRAMLLASMYILGNTENIELNQNTDDDANDFAKSLADLNYRSKVAEEFDKIFENKTTDKDFEDRNIYSLSNDKYDIKYINWVSENDYSVSGTINWSISLNE